MLWLLFELLGLTTVAGDGLLEGDWGFLFAMVELETEIEAFLTGLDWIAGSLMDFESNATAVTAVPMVQETKARNANQQIS